MLSRQLTDPSLRSLASFSLPITDDESTGLLVLLVLAVLLVLVLVLLAVLMLVVVLVLELLLRFSFFGMSTDDDDDDDDERRVQRTHRLRAFCTRHSFPLRNRRRRCRLLRSRP